MSMSNATAVDQSSRRSRFFDIFSFLVVLAVGVDLVYMHAQLRKIERLVIAGDSAVTGDKLLPMIATTVSGAKISIPADRKRLVFYISRHCGACTKAMPAWSDTARTLGRENVLFLLADSDPEALREMPAFLASYRLQGFSAVKVDERLMSRLNMFSVPRALLVGSDGTIQKVWQGTIDQKALLKIWDSRG